MKTKPLTMHDLVKPGLPDRPDWLSPDARKIWDDLAPQLVEAQILTRLDSSVFAMFCTDSAAFAHLSKVLDKSGSTYTTPSGTIRARPEFAMYERIARRLMKLENDLAMTPRSRRRIPARQPQPLRITDDRTR